ncbi:MAG: hypothetical protein LLG20_18380 [Acidobacteriales bacterium]|nr:hypothetical protein [Terriglobales bacterium]
MANGCACLYSDYDGGNKFYHAETVKARKQHKCCECGARIVPCQQYETVTGKSDSDIWRFKTCLPCVEIRGQFYCGGSWDIGNLWDSMQEYAFPSLTMCCLLPLSIEAQRKLVDRYSDWQDIDDD